MVNGPDDDVEREEARKHAMPHKGHAPRRACQWGKLASRSSVRGRFETSTWSFVGESRARRTAYSRGKEAVLHLMGEQIVGKKRRNPWTLDIVPATAPKDTRRRCSSPAGANQGLTHRAATAKLTYRCHPQRR
jgi:hypothetical protein